MRLPLLYLNGTAQATRLFGNVVIVIAAWYHSPIVIALGIAIVLAAWTYGLALSRRHS